MCTYACSFPLTCQNGAVSCSSWSFESRTAENWAYQFVDLAPAPVASFSTVRAFAGSVSLAAPFFTATTVQVALCAGGVAASVGRKMFHARVFFDTSGATFVNQGRNDNQVYASIRSGPDGNAPLSLVTQAFFDPAAGTGTAILPNTWVSLDGTIPTDGVTASGVVLEISALLDSPPQTYLDAGGGILYIDDVRIF
jgi:hypothetical protein